MSDGRRVLWIDAGAGAAGDMLLAALWDLGVPLARLREGLSGLEIRGWSLSGRKVERAGVAARKARVRVQAVDTARSRAQVLRLLRDGGLPAAVRRRASEIFRRLFDAEARVHGRSPGRVHLHEAGDDDALIDVVGVCLALEHLRPERIVVSPMTTGHGSVRCRHGVYPVPSPVTTLLIRGAPVRGGEVEAERLTPTGAAILTTIADAWGPLPPMIPLAVGLGAGDRDFAGHPNVLRAVLGRPLCAGGPEGGEVVVIELNLDDDPPQNVAFAARRALEAGALEAFVTPVVMKKGRPGHLLTVIVAPDDVGPSCERLLRETSSLGLRFRTERRLVLDREVRRVRTRWGTVRIKTGRIGETRKAWPEYDDCVAIALRHGVPLREVQQAALRSYRSKRKS